MSGEQFIQQIGVKVLARLTQIVEHFQAKGQIIDVPASSLIRMTSSTLIGYFITKYASP
ncbi:hypothetical protein ACFPRA_07740 [Sporosarcina soli]|uniref:Uncharacterized protein n=1 Tax=Sporosarcina soli TaxID=334736 RepID=A0ABW0TJ21_9BACL